MKILVVVPAYNEAGSIRGVIEDLRNNFPEGEVLVVNDGSSDSTGALARGFGANVIDMPYNVGIGGVMQTGFIHALREGFEAAIQFDGDGQHRADEISKILRPWQIEGADLVVGSRFLSEEGFTSSVQRRIGAKILSFVVTALIRKKITDTTSGFRLYSRKAIEFFADYYPEDYPEVEALILAHKKGFRIKEVAARLDPRATGKSSITTTRAVYYMVKVLLAILVDLLKKLD